MAESGENIEPSAQNLPQESGNGGGNKKPPSTAVSSPAPDEPPKKGRRLSGFADPNYWTPERREAKRQYAKKMYEEGRLGGAQPGAGRPRKNKLLSEVVTEKAADKAEKIAKDLIEMATQHRAPTVRLGAIDRIITMEQNVQKNMRDDEKELLKLSGKSLDAALAETLSEYGVGYDLELPESEVEEIEEGDEE